MSPLPAPFSLDRSYELARICKAVYPGPVNQAQLSFAGRSLTEQRIVHGSFGRGYARLFWNAETTVIAFRGTREGVDWQISNLRAFPVPLRDCGPARPLVHRGFQNTLDYGDKTTGLRSLDALFAHLEEARLLSRRIVVTGHSLGGALALLFAAKLMARHPGLVQENLDQIVTFGAPAAGLHGFRRHLAPLAARSLRVVNRSDPVPFTPPLFYRHVGQELWLSRRGIVSNPGWPRRALSGARSLFARAVEDHAIALYAERLGNLRN